MVKVLIVGSGGREHAIAWKLRQSPHLDALYVASGNVGTAAIAENVPVMAYETDALIDFVRENAIDLTIVGPEAPLASGIVDAFQAAGLRIFGPTQAAAKLEASKAFSKQFMEAHHIPTAQYGVFTRYEDAKNAIDAANGPLVVKADGLAAGKGVIVCETPDDAQEALTLIMFNPEFKGAGETIILEELLTGYEVSMLAFSDGKTAVSMPLARDHKRLLDDDMGPNTGGMGAIAPVPELSESDAAYLHEEIIQRVVSGMAEDGIPYVGVLYAGLMITPSGPKVLEFNCRFGDPETQALLPLLESDLLEIFWGCTEGRLDEVNVQWRAGACASVVLASPGYPGAYLKGLPINGVEKIASDDVILFHAGTAIKNSQLITAGGRVLCVSGLGDDLPAALENAYGAIKHIKFDGMHYRRDIGKVRNE